VIPLVRARGVAVRIDGRRVLDAVDVEVLPGEVVAVAGPSGSGKSTLLGVVAGLVAAGAGTVEVPEGTRVATVLQSYGVLDELTVAENVELALQIRAPRRAGSATQLRDRAREALEQVGVGTLADRLTGDLSGGQRQRVAVARALAVDPDLLLADEPTSELDAATRERVLDVLVAVGRRGGGVLLATHDPEAIARCDRTVPLRDGRVIGAT
jgi:putative ABC transport system ATP-binding protein